MIADNRQQTFTNKFDIAHSSNCIINPLNGRMNIYSNGVIICCMLILNYMTLGHTLSESCIKLGYARQGAINRLFVNKLKSDGLIAVKPGTVSNTYTITSKGIEVLKMWLNEFRTIAANIDHL